MIKYPRYPTKWPLTILDQNMVAKTDKYGKRFYWWWCCYHIHYQCLSIQDFKEWQELYVQVPE